MVKTKKETAEYKQAWYKENRKNILFKQKEDHKDFSEEKKKQLSEYKKAWYKENRSRLLELNKQNYIKNKQAYLDRASSYYNNNKEKVKEYKVKYTDDNKEYILQYHKVYRDNNPHRFLNLPSRGYVTFVVKPLILIRDNHKCVLCGGKVKLQCHHIIPAKCCSESEVLSEDNLITLCKVCHMVAHDGHYSKINIKLQSALQYYIKYIRTI